MNATDFLPAIREVAAYRVGKNRTDRDDIARILFEFGVRGTTAELQLCRKHFPDPAMSEADAKLVAELNQQIERSGMSHDEAVKLFQQDVNCSREVWECLKFSKQITAIHKKYPVAADQYTQWITEHETELRELCLTVADEILAVR